MKLIKMSLKKMSKAMMLMTFKRSKDYTNAIKIKDTLV